MRHKNVVLITLTKKSDGKPVKVNPENIVFLEDCEDGVGTKVVFGADFVRQVTESMCDIQRHCQCMHNDMKA